MFLGVAVGPPHTIWPQFEVSRCPFDSSLLSSRDIPKIPTFFSVTSQKENPGFSFITSPYSSNLLYHLFYPSWRKTTESLVELALTVNCPAHFEVENQNQAAQNGEFSSSNFTPLRGYKRWSRESEPLFLTYLYPN